MVRSIPSMTIYTCPQVTFGPKRWQMPKAGSSFTTLKANELQTTVNPEKLKAASQGLAHMGKAFAAATAVIFGGAALTFGLAASKLEVCNKTLWWAWLAVQQWST